MHLVMSENETLQSQFALKAIRIFFYIITLELCNSQSMSSVEGLRTSRPKSYYTK